MSALHRFVVLYALVYAAFGVASPFMPAFFKGRGLSREQLVRWWDASPTSPRRFAPS
jgi:hypothetical protein